MSRATYLFLVFTSPSLVVCHLSELCILFSTSGTVNTHSCPGLTLLVKITIWFVTLTAQKTVGSFIVCGITHIIVNLCLCPVNTLKISVTNLITLNDHLYRLRLPCKHQPGWASQLFPGYYLKKVPGLIVMLFLINSHLHHHYHLYFLVMNFQVIFLSLWPASFLIFSESLYFWLINDLILCLAKLWKRNIKDI